MKKKGVKKGNIPWNKGKKGIQTAWNKGLVGLAGNKNGNWKGGEIENKCLHCEKLLKVRLFK